MPTPVTIMRVFRTALNWISAHKFLSAAIVLGIAVLLFLRAGGAEEIVESPEHTRSVSLALVSALSSDITPLPTVGEVVASTEADLRAEAGGRVTSVNVELGDRVGAGNILIETENSSQRAALLQAEGALDAARASLAKVQSGTRSEQLANLGSTLDSAQGSALTTLLAAYAAVDSAVRDTADDMFTGVELGQINFTIATANQQTELSLEQHRGRLATVLARHDAVSPSLAKGPNLVVELKTTEAELRDVRQFLDTLLSALSDAIVTDAADETDIATFRAAATAARTAITASLSAVLGAQNAIDIASNNLEQGVVGAQAEDIAAAEATVKQVQGSYNATLAALEKTRVRTPIAGTVTNLTVSEGDFVGAQSQVAIVSNNGALEIITYVSELERTQITPGAVVLVDRQFEGVVTRVAPVIDPVTRRVEVRVGLTGEHSLSSGSTVKLEIARSSSSATAAGTLSIPVSAVKLEAERAVVFTLENGILVGHPIILGPLLGDRVEILEGLDPTWSIVLDARGLKEGQAVIAE